MQLGTLHILQPAWLILSLLAIVAAIALRTKVNNNDWKQLISVPVMSFLGAQRLEQPSINHALFSLAIVAAALSQPVIKVSNNETWRHSIGWVVLADVSRSMTLSDIVPSRMSALRDTLATLSEASAARPISLIVYAGDAFLVSPPSFDRTLYNENAALLEHGIINTEGSNLARALSLATSVIQESQMQQARIFVVTDSGGINDNSIEAANYLTHSGHQLDVVLLGTQDDAVLDSSTFADTRVNKVKATQLANAGNGHLVVADRLGKVDLDALELQAQAEPSSHPALRALIWQLQSHWLLLLALPFLLLLFRKAGTT